MEKERILFFITPIGEQGSKIRDRTDKVYKHIIEPVSIKCDFKPLRADQIPRPGIITNQVIDCVIDSPLAIADLTGHNPNVFFELAIRYATKKPAVQIIEKGERIPFDIASMRTISIDIHDLDNVEESKSEIINQIKTIEEIGEEIDNPVSNALRAFNLSQSNDTEKQILADSIKMMAKRTEALANLNFDEKIAVMAHNKEEIKGEVGFRFIERVRNDFIAASHLKEIVDPSKREELITNYMIPIIENAIQNNKLISDYPKARMLEQIIEIALEYNVEKDILKNFKKKLLNL